MIGLVITILIFEDGLHLQDLLSEFSVGGDMIRGVVCELIFLKFVALLMLLFFILSLRNKFNYTII